MEPRFAREHVWSRLRNLALQLSQRLRTTTRDSWSVPGDRRLNSSRFPRRCEVVRAAGVTRECTSSRRYSVTRAIKTSVG